MFLVTAPHVISDARVGDGLVSRIWGLRAEPSQLQPGLYPGAVDHPEPQVGCARDESGWVPLELRVTRPRRSDNLLSGYCESSSPSLPSWLLFLQKNENFRISDNLFSPQKAECTHSSNSPLHLSLPAFFHLTPDHMQVVAINRLFFFFFLYFYC